MRIRLFALAVPLLITTCGAAPAPDATVEAGAVFTLAPGAAARLSGADLTVRFDGVDGDSRCPTGVQCVWEGDATVKVSATARGNTTAHEFHTSGRSGDSATVDGHRVRLVGLTPMPRAGASVPPQDYRADLRID